MNNCPRCNEDITDIVESEARATVAFAVDEMQELEQENQRLEKAGEIKDKNTATEIAGYKEENQNLIDKISRIKDEIEKLETQDTSPEHDEGFADAIERALDCFDDWPK